MIEKVVWVNLIKIMYSHHYKRKKQNSAKDRKLKIICNLTQRQPHNHCSSIFFLSHTSICILRMGSNNSSLPSSAGVMFQDPE